MLRQDKQPVSEFEEILQEKAFVLVDKAFAGGPGGLLLDQRIDADTRDPIPVSRAAIP